MIFILSFRKSGPKMKRTDAQIYVLCHKDVPYGIRSNSLYTSIECGAACRDVHPSADIRDDDGADNMSVWNPFMAENTALYWIWKHHDRGLKYIGNVQYRRLLDFDENTDFDSLFRRYDAISCKPLSFKKMTVAEQFDECHGIKYLNLVGDIIRERYPRSYYRKWRRFIFRRHRLYYSCGFVLRAAEYDRYVGFLFDIFSALNERIGVQTVQQAMDYTRTEIEKGFLANREKREYRYSEQLEGFLAERIFTFWIRMNFRRILEIQYTLMEDSKI